MYSKIKARKPQEKQMRTLENAAVAKTKKQKPKFNLKRYLNDNKYVYLMMFPVIVWFGIFCYWPITWIRMAFYDYSLTFGFSGSTFVLFNNFLDFFEGEFLHLLGNTLAINLLALVFLFPSAIVLALAFNEVRCKWYKRTLSVISYLPHFLFFIRRIYSSFTAGIISSHLLTTVREASRPTRTRFSTFAMMSAILSAVLSGSLSHSQPFTPSVIP